MKTTVIAGILFLLVLVFLGVNFYMLNAIFDETLALFSTLPVSAEALEQASEEELTAISLRLNEIYGLWQKHETYLCFGLEHAASRSFLETYLPAMAYFEAKEYPAFLAQTRAARDIVKHLVFDESIRLGNIL